MSASRLLQGIALACQIDDSAGDAWQSQWGRRAFYYRQVVTPHSETATKCSMSQGPLVGGTVWATAMRLHPFTILRTRS